MRGLMIVGAMVMVAGTASAQTCVTRVVLDTSGLAQSRAYGVSADGRVVVGEATFHGGPLRAYRWTAEEGAKNLGTAGGTQSSASAVSADGRTVVGSTTTDATLARSPMRWTEETGMVALTPLRGGAVAVSADGSVVAGNYTNASGQSRVFRWTA